MLTKFGNWLRPDKGAGNLGAGNFGAGNAAAAADAPRFLFLLINKRCNLKCVHCSFWREDDSDKANYLDREGKRSVLREFAAMNPRGAVVICGGESMLDLDDYFDVCSQSRSLGLTCISVVNGTRIRTPEMAERMILEGPHEISISLNSHRRELHDETRGVAGAFAKAVKAARLLVDARRRLGAKATKIYVMGLIFDQNYRDLEAFYDFVLNDIGADKLKLNFIQPSFGDNETDRFLADHHNIDSEEMAAIIRRCDARFRLRINPAWIEAVTMYLDSLRGQADLENGWGSVARTRDHICNTYERNIMVDHYGLARLCFSDGFRGAQLREEGDLRAFWTGAGDVREEMRSCNKLCGISHSVRRTSCTLAPAAYSLPGGGAPKRAGLSGAAGRLLHLLSSDRGS
jgi:MoaA/NifB/PqqE/SkfB family radical SAM enzyme